MARSNKIVETLKKEIRKRGFNYKKIAEELDMSESGVKRMFASSNFSLKRLDDICDVVGIEVSDLLSIVENQERVMDSLSYEDEKTLTADTALLLVAYCVANYYTAEEIVENYKITEAQCTRYLARLDKMNMIELQPGNRIRLLISNNFQWQSNGPIEQYFRQQVQQEFLNATFTDDGAIRLVKNGGLSLKARSRLVERINALGDFFEELCKEERKLPLASKDGSSMVLAIRPWVHSAFKKLERA